MPELTTTYLGLQLSNPLVASSVPLSKRIDSVQRLEEAGIGAVVLYSLFEEQINSAQQVPDHLLNASAASLDEAQTYLPDMGTYSLPPEHYLEHIRQLKQAVGIPIIASLNGVSSGAWTGYARLIEQAGADAIELNTYYLPVDPDLTAATIEDSYVALVRDICAQTRLPVAVKLSPYITALPNLVRRLVGAGARGLVLFNRFYQPDLDIESLEMVSNLTASDSRDLRLPLRWAALLYGQVAADLAISGGVHSCEDVVKAVMAGGNVAMVATELLAHGSERVGELLRELGYWMDEQGYSSIRQMRGLMSQERVTDPAALERANYMKVLSSFDARLRFSGGATPENPWPSLCMAEDDPFWNA